MPLQPHATVPPPPAPVVPLVLFALLALPVVLAVLVVLVAPPLLLAPPVPVVLPAPAPVVLPVVPTWAGPIPQAARSGATPARASVNPRAYTRPTRFELMSLPSSRAMVTRLCARLSRGEGAASKGEHPAPGLGYHRNLRARKGWWPHA